MPGAGNPQAWNRYAYTLYNPLRYIDPSGQKRQSNTILIDGDHQLISNGNLTDGGGGSPYYVFNGEAASAYILTITYEDIIELTSQAFMEREGRDFLHIAEEDHRDNAYYCVVLIMMAVTDEQGGGWQYEYDFTLFAWDKASRYNHTDMLLDYMGDVPGVSVMYDLPVDEMIEEDIVLIHQDNINLGTAYNHARMVTAVNVDGTVYVTEALGTFDSDDEYDHKILTRDFWDVSVGYDILNYVVIRIH